MGLVGAFYHLPVHCRWASSLWHLGLSLMGIRWVHPWKVKDVLSSLEKENEEVSGFWCLEVDPVGYLVVYLEGKKLKDFLGQRFILA